MNSVRLISLYSGSSGNAFLIATPTGNLLIDAGKSAKALSRALESVGVSSESIGAILVTHEHADHVNALPVFLKKHPLSVYLPKKSAQRMSTDATVAPYLIGFEQDFSKDILGMRVTAFPTPHDTAASVGYRIEIPQGDAHITVGYATDIGYVTREIEEGLSGCDAVILESNHDVEMLTHGPYPAHLKQRILSRRGHLSNPESALLAAKLCARGTKSLMLAHLSQENNTPELAYDEAFCAIADTRVHLCVAQPSTTTEMSL